MTMLCVFKEIQPHTFPMLKSSLKAYMSFHDGIFTCPTQVAKASCLGADNCQTQRNLFPVLKTLCSKQATTKLLYKQFKSIENV